VQGVLRYKNNKAHDEISKDSDFIHEETRRAHDEIYQKDSNFIHEETGQKHYEIYKDSNLIQSKQHISQSD